MARGALHLRARPRAVRAAPRRGDVGSAMGEGYSVHEQAWPAYDEALIAEEEITLVVQVNGKLRDRIERPGGHLGGGRQGAGARQREGPPARRGQGDPQEHLRAGAAGQPRGGVARSGLIALTPNRRRGPEPSPDTLASVRVFGDHGAFGGLYQDPAGTLEDIWNVSPLPRPVKVLNETSLLTPVRTPPLQAIADVGVGEGGGARVEQDRLPVGGDGHLARAMQDHVEEAAGEPARALDPVDVPLDARLDSQHVVAVDGHPLVRRGRGS